jgi:integrase
MTKKKFNPKVFQEKLRVFQPVSSFRGISKQWNWNATKNCYEVTAKSPFQVRKTVLKFGLPQRLTRFFETGDEARIWQIKQESETCSTADSFKLKSKITFNELVEDFKLKSLPSRAKTTQAQYEKMLSRYFDPLLPVEISKLTPNIVDEWIGYLMKHKRTKERFSFNHELDLLSLILNYYADMNDDFINPVRRRHRKSIRIKKPICRKKDLLESEFFKFRIEVEKQKQGQIFSSLATIQFYQALRVSEAAAINWEDIHFDMNSHSQSRLSICRSVKWIRSKGATPFIEDNYKNSSANNGSKESPLMPESYLALQKFGPKKNGLVFSNDDGSILTFRQIQHAFNSAFKAAGLPYSGTHIMRHGGCRLVFNRTGDISMAQQILGNRDLKTVQVYAQRETKALNGYAEQLWKNHHESLAANGCKTEKVEEK